MSQRSDEATLMQQPEQPGQKVYDDDTFIGASFLGAASIRSPTDVMQLYLNPSEDVVKSGNDNNSAEGDRPMVHQIKADIDGLFQRMKQRALAVGENHVTVCVYAPINILNIYQKACINFSDARVSFDLHAE
jgi:hypothetical protein